MGSDHHSSPAYQKDGLLIITFDEGGLTIAANSSGVTISAPGVACCNQQPGPNRGPFPQTSNLGPYTLTLNSFGGDRTGAVLSPYFPPGTVSNDFYNHYSMLKTLEDMFEVSYLDYTGQPGLLPFFGCVSSDMSSGGSASHCQNH